ncbi:TPA: tail fiber assembly protein [Citrobacter freundii]|uniref:tail fiber assembly protein n=1 Tax=Obesumbacterium proteus TaxID=82983 RepID=UPI00242AE554|nr:tail fiber assembly protein [Obesumbacterium proteus]
MKIFYSPSLNGFLLEQTANQYDGGNLVEISQETYDEFLTGRTDKLMGPGPAGPVWIDLPEPTVAELVAQAAASKSALLTEADRIIAPMKDALDGGYIDEVDKPRLVSWQKYRYALTKVDPAKPVWPVKPE